jgi:hypothetical protein
VLQRHRGHDQLADEHLLAADAQHDALGAEPRRSAQVLQRADDGLLVDHDALADRLEGNAHLVVAHQLGRAAAVSGHDLRSTDHAVPVVQTDGRRSHRFAFARRR